MKTVDLVYFDAGGGHRAAALALQQVIREQERPWRVRLVHLGEALDPQARLRGAAGFVPETYYNRRLQLGWTFGLGQELRLLQCAIRLAHETMLRRLARHWDATAPDLVVSLVPNFNRALYESLAAARPGVPCATVMTDLADHPPHFWIEPGQEQTIVCATGRAVEQARAAGRAERHIVRTSGMILRPSFYRRIEHDRAADRRALGLDPARPTAVVMFGGHGSAQMLRIARTLDRVQLLLLCGRNERLAQRLHMLRRGAPHAALGHVDDVARALSLGDFMIGKPGPGSLSEALHLGLPVITFLNASTLPQERFNAQWLHDQQLGLVVDSPRRLGLAVAGMLHRLDDFRASAARLDNRAVFEVPDILARLLDGAPPQPAPMRQPVRAAAPLPSALAA
jgi:UDP-N-acetylglucosamine:LPS N-acetylglucosamine transferase